LSGVTYALMGYLTVLNLRYGKENYHIDRLLIVFMLALIPLSFLGDSSHFLSNTLSSILGKTSDYAHLGGFFSGIVLAFIYAFMTKLPPTAFNPFNPFNNQVK
jgi:membrane associated rhomboid family serine protease